MSLKQRIHVNMSVYGLMLSMGSFFHALFHAESKDVIMMSGSSLCSSPSGFIRDQGYLILQCSFTLHPDIFPLGVPPTVGLHVQVRLHPRTFPWWGQGWGRQADHRWTQNHLVPRVSPAPASHPPTQNNNTLPTSNPGVAPQYEYIWVHWIDEWQCTSRDTTSPVNTHYGPCWCWDRPK